MYKHRYVPKERQSDTLTLSILTWLPVIPEERSGIWPVDQEIDGPHGQWNTFLLYEQQIIFKWNLVHLTPSALSRNTKISVTQEKCCFSIRIGLMFRQSLFKLRTTSLSLSLFFSFFPLSLSLRLKQRSLQHSLILKPSIAQTQVSQTQHIHNSAFRSLLKHCMSGKYIVLILIHSVLV